MEPRMMYGIKSIRDAVGFAVPEELGDVETINDVLQRLFEREFKFYLFAGTNNLLGRYATEEDLLKGVAYHSNYKDFSVLLAKPYHLEETVSYVLKEGPSE